MFFEARIVRQKIELKNHPDYCEASACDNPNYSFFGLLGLGLLEILLRSHSCPQFTCDLYNAIQENIINVDDIILSKGLDKERKIFCQLVDLMNYNVYPRSQLAVWLNCYMIENRDFAVTSMITIIQLIIYRLCKNESFKEEILNLSSPIPKPSFEKIIKIICENFPIHIKIVSEDIKVHFRLGTNTFPVITFYQNNNSLYLLYNKQVADFDEGPDIQVNLLVEPFVEKHTKILDKPKPNPQKNAFKLENIGEGPFIINDEQLVDCTSILPPGPKTYIPEAIKMTENLENNESGRKSPINKIISPENAFKIEQKYRPSSPFESMKNHINKGPEIQSLKNVNPNATPISTYIKENPSENTLQEVCFTPQVYAQPKLNPTPPLPFADPASKGPENMSNPSNSNFPPSNLITAKNDFTPKVNNQIIPDDKNKEIPAKAQVENPPKPNLFSKPPEQYLQVSHQIKLPEPYPQVSHQNKPPESYPQFPHQNKPFPNAPIPTIPNIIPVKDDKVQIPTIPNIIPVKDDKVQVPNPGDSSKLVPKIPTPTPITHSTVPIVTHCPPPVPQSKIIENPLSPALPKFNQPDEKKFPNLYPHVQQVPYPNAGYKPNSYSPMPPQSESELIKKELNQNPASFGQGNPDQHSKFVYVSPNQEIIRQKTPDTFIQKFPDTSNFSNVPPIPNTRNDKSPLKLLESNLTPPKIPESDINKGFMPSGNLNISSPPEIHRSDVNKGYVPPGSFNIPTLPGRVDYSGKPPLPEYATRPRFDKKLLEIVGVMSEIIISEKSDNKNMFEKITKIMDGDSELENIESLISLKNFKKLKMNMMMTGKIKCGICQLEKDRDDFSITTCGENNCKCCSKCRTVDIIKGCPCCCRTYSEYEIDLLNVAKMSLVK
ncbi:hypothetical protein SteCoe_33000 [Stentor coeruleus]|uniref:Uncharacterized protein n=1 Tax=Stentor coeruleus TaxID=5963 RepID=A0A1R2AXT2_9CILI|nr:hypothetical protein SteCoe_33000 [Stentor coeruleus]